ncbi:MAG TPA: FAD-binding oxidoreductase [Solirubrobacteraceae bacterium]|nr:FAD-binding oxidoreductase [Solirubrobacteraceae bacterium]
MLNTEIIEQDMPALAGEIVTPGQPEWDLARRAWNLAVDQRPAYVALPANADDVAAVVAFARRHGLRVAPQGTGHNAAPIASLDETILLSTQRMRGVEIDPDEQIARVQAGTLWLEVTEAATPHSLYPLSGSSPDVGVVGYTLGGGLSWLARKHGLASDSVTAIELVTPAGELLRATAEDHAELFWALRGGGGNFGVVTAMEFRLYPYEDVYAGMLLFPYERHAEVLRAWHDWTRTAPEEITTSLRIMHLPPLPELPPFLAGRSIVVIDGAYAGDAEEGAAAIAPLRALAPELDTFAPSSPAVLSRIHMDPEEPMPARGAGTILGATDDATLTAFAAGLQPGAPVMFGELRHLGGAVGRRPAGAGALGALEGEYLVFAGGAVMAPEMESAVEAGLAAFIDGLAPWVNGRLYLNLAESATDPVEFFGEETYARLRAVRAAVDPDGVMVANHAI